jgi:hypothetical protein
MGYGVRFSFLVVIRAGTRRVSAVSTKETRQTMTSQLMPRRPPQHLLMWTALALCQIGCFHQWPPVAGPPQIPTELRRVTGHVTDELKYPLADVLVRFHNEKTGSENKAITDEGGKYYVRVPPGQYVVTAQAEGFELTTERVDVHEFSELDQTLNLELAEEAGQRTTGRSLLFRDQKEVSGYGLYSYLLFRDPPGKGHTRLRERYLSAIEAYLQKIYTIEEEGRRHPRPELNIIYAPVNRKPEGRPLTPEWILKHYDFVRAEHMLDLFGESSQSSGPYIVSTLKPLSSSQGRRNAPSPHLFQDLTSVEPKIVELWISEFKKQASTREFWEPSLRDMAVLHLRNAIEEGARELKEVPPALIALGELLKKLNWSD